MFPTLILINQIIYKHLPEFNPSSKTSLDFYNLYKHHNGRKASPKPQKHITLNCIISIK